MFITPPNNIQADITDPLEGPVTWYEITHAGKECSETSKNKATRTSPP